MSVATAPAPTAPAAAPVTAPVSPDTQKLVLAAVKKVTAISTLPEVTAKIVTTVEDPKSTASQLHKIISHDPALVTRILKVVNSAFYGLPGQIASVERAIVLLGLNAVKNIAVAASLGQMFRGVKLCEGFTAKDLWTHCVGVAVVARDIAKQMKLPIADEAFLAGMIHDLGILVELQVMPEQLTQVCEKAKATGGDFCAIEREITGIDHQMLGAGLSEQWKFPRSCQVVAGFHHQPQLLDKQHRMLSALVFIADTLCCQANQGFNLTALQQKMDEAGLWDLQIDPALIERTRTNVAAIVETSRAFM